MDSGIVFTLKNRYAHLYPTLVSRSIERAQNETELFDILDTVPLSLPVRWDHHSRRWVNCDLYNLPHRELIEDRKRESL